MSTAETVTARDGTQGRGGSHWRRMRVWASAHAVDDFYQGLVPAAVPYFVLERQFSYLSASGLALAATLGSALPQLAVGVLADRHRLPWIAPLGVSLAGIGAGLAGLAPTYPLVFALLLLSGFGVAMFHPPAGRDARRAALGSTTAMSYFAAGGSVGFFVAPALATPALDGRGVGATALFIPPAVLMGFVLLRQQRRAVDPSAVPTHGWEHSSSGRRQPGQTAMVRTLSRAVVTTSPTPLVRTILPSARANPRASSSRTWRGMSSASLRSLSSRAAQAGPHHLP